MAGPHFRAPHVLEADGKTPVATRRRPIPALSLWGRVRGAERWIGRPVSASELEQPSVGVVPLGTIHRCGGSVGPTAIAEYSMLPYWRCGRHNGSMPNIQIKDVPDDTHAVLRQRASAAHQSLQEYLRSKLIAEASQPTVDDVLDRAGGRAGGSLPLADAVSALRFERARH